MAHQTRASSVPTLSSAYPLQLQMLPQQRRASRCTNTLRSWQVSSLHTCFPPLRSMSSMTALTLGTSSLSKNSSFFPSARTTSLKRSKLAPRRTTPLRRLSVQNMVLTVSVHYIYYIFTAFMGPNLQPSTWVMREASRQTFPARGSTRAPHGGHQESWICRQDQDR